MIDLDCASSDSIFRRVDRWTEVLGPVLKPEWKEKSTSCPTIKGIFVKLRNDLTALGNNKIASEVPRCSFGEVGPADLVAKIDNGMSPSTGDPSKHHVGPSN